MAAVSPARFGRRLYECTIDAVIAGDCSIGTVLVLGPAGEWYDIPLGDVERDAILLLDRAEVRKDILDRLSVIYGDSVKGAALWEIVDGGSGCFSIDQRKERDEVSLFGRIALEGPMSAIEPTPAYARYLNSARLTSELVKMYGPKSRARIPLASVPTASDVLVALDLSTTLPAAISIIEQGPTSAPVTGKEWEGPAMLLAAWPSGRVVREKYSGRGAIYQYACGHCDPDRLLSLCWQAALIQDQHFDGRLVADFDLGPDSWVVSVTINHGGTRFQLNIPVHLWNSASRSLSDPKSASQSAPPRGLREQAILALLQAIVNETPIGSNELASSGTRILKVR